MINKVCAEKMSKQLALRLYVRGAFDGGYAGYMHIRVLQWGRNMKQGKTDGKEGIVPEILSSVGEK